MPPVPKFANLQEVLLEGSGTESGVVAGAVEERLAAELRRFLIDFFERSFAWCAAVSIPSNIAEGYGRATTQDCFQTRAAFALARYVL